MRRLQSRRIHYLKTIAMGIASAAARITSVVQSTSDQFSSLSSAVRHALNAPNLDPRIDSKNRSIFGRI
jgi:hypothetical protein